MNVNNSNWISVHYPLVFGDQLPPERRMVQVWCASSAIPWVGYLRYAAGCLDSPFFVVPHGNDEKPVDVIAWCDCLNLQTPPGIVDNVTLAGRGFSARIHNREDVAEQQREWKAGRGEDFGEGK